MRFSMRLNPVCDAGVVLNPMTPEWLQTLLLTILLIVVVRKTFQKGVRQWHEERKCAATL